MCIVVLKACLHTLPQLPLSRQRWWDVMSEARRSEAGSHGAHEHVRMSGCLATCTKKLQKLQRSLGKKLRNMWQPMPRPGSSESNRFAPSRLTRRLGTWEVWNAESALVTWLGVLGGIPEPIGAYSPRLSRLGPRPSSVIWSLDSLGLPRWMVCMHTCGKRPVHWLDLHSRTRHGWKAG